MIDLRGRVICKKRMTLRQAISRIEHIFTRREYVIVHPRGGRMKPYPQLFLTMALLAISGPYAVSPQDSPGRGQISRNDKPSIIFIGDLQRTGWGERLVLREQNDRQRQAVVNGIAAENPAFLLMLGDIVSSGGSTSAWKYFDACTRPLREQRIPLLAVPGNHDYFGCNPKAMDHFTFHFPLMEGRTWTSVRMQGLGVILLNSNFSQMSSAMIDSQEIWYGRKLHEFQIDSTVSIIVVGCHHSPFTNSTVVPESKEVRTRFVSAFADTQKAKLFISGHCHSYERFMEYGKTFVVSGGAGGPRQKVIVDTTKQRRRDLFEKGLEHPHPIRPFHYCKLLIEKDRLVVQMVKLDESLKWSVGDTFSITCKSSELNRFQ